LTFRCGVIRSASFARIVPHRNFMVGRSRRCGKFLCCIGCLDVWGTSGPVSQHPAGASGDAVLVYSRVFGTPICGRCRSKHAGEYSGSRDRLDCMRGGDWRLRLARRTLGTNWSGNSDDQGRTRVESSAVLSVVRHPIYKRVAAERWGRCHGWAMDLSVGSSVVATVAAVLK